MTDPCAAFGPNLKAARLARGWSQEHAAHQTGLGLATIQRAEGGSGVYLATAVILAAAYGTTLDALLTPAQETDDS